MIDALLHAPAVRLINRVLRDYPLAQKRLASHANKSVQLALGPAVHLMRIAPTGLVEIVGEGAEVAPDVLMAIPLAEIPALLRKDEAAFRAVQFTGDSELASLLAELSRELKWDAEEDLSRVIGDIAAHRVVSTGASLAAWQADAKTRLTENMAEYLTEELNAFVTAPEFESLVTQNETLRDDIARLEARIRLLQTAP